MTFQRDGAFVICFYHITLLAEIPLILLYKITSLPPDKRFNVLRRTSITIGEDLRGQLTPFETFTTMPCEIVETRTPLTQKMIGWRSAKPGPPNVSGLYPSHSKLLEDALQLRVNQAQGKRM